MNYDASSSSFADRNRGERKPFSSWVGGIEPLRSRAISFELALGALLHLAPGPEPRRLMRGSALLCRDISTVCGESGYFTRSMSLLRYTSLIISRMRPLTSVRIRPPNLPTPWSTWTMSVAYLIWPSSLSERATLPERATVAAQTATSWKRSNIWWSVNTQILSYGRQSLRVRSILRG